MSRYDIIDAYNEEISRLNIPIWVFGSRDQYKTIRNVYPRNEHEYENGISGYQLHLNLAQFTRLIRETEPLYVAPSVEVCFAHGLCKVSLKCHTRETLTSIFDRDRDDLGIFTEEQT